MSNAQVMPQAVDVFWRTQRGSVSDVLPPSAASLSAKKDNSILDCICKSSASTAREVIIALDVAFMRSPEILGWICGSWYKTQTRASPMGAIKMGWRLKTMKYKGTLSELSWKVKGGPGPCLRYQADVHKEDNARIFSVMHGERTRWVVESPAPEVFKKPVDVV